MKGYDDMSDIYLNTPIGYAYVPIQRASDRNLYDPETGLERGTIFPPLDLPLGVYGKQNLNKEAMKNE